MGISTGQDRRDISALAYVYAQYKVGDPIIKWTIEVKMVIVMLRYWP